MEEHLCAKSLRLDTMIMNATINDQDRIIYFKDNQIYQEQTIVKTQKDQIKDDKKAYADLSEELKKVNKKNERLKIVAWVITGVSAILAIVVAIK